MKKFAIVLYALLTSYGMLLSASSQNLKVMNIYELSAHDLNEIMFGQHPEVAVEFSAQTALPLHFLLKGDIINLHLIDKNNMSIEVNQTFYMRRIEQMLLFSTNLTDWKPLSEFITGNVSFSISIEEGEPSFSIGADALLRS